MSDAKLSAYRKTIESVRPLAGEERAPPPTERVKFIKVDTEQSVFEWCAQRVIFGTTKRRMLIMNDLHEDAILKAWQTIKLLAMLGKSNR